MAERFCQRCEVHVSLHPDWDGEPTEADCRAADARASSLERIGRVLVVSAPRISTAEHRIDWGQFGWSCTCGAGRKWPLAPYSRGKAAGMAHQRAEARKARMER